LFLVPEDAIGLYATVWVGITVVLTLYFVLGYAIFSDWRGSQEGWHVLTFSALIAVASTWSFVQLVVIGPANLVAAASYGRAGVWISVAFSMGWRSWLWTSRQIAARKRQQEASTRSDVYGAG
jgi:hypothetical protein